MYSQKKKYKPNFTNPKRTNDIENQTRDNTNIVSLIHRCNELIEDINNDAIIIQKPI